MARIGRTLGALLISAGVGIGAWAVVVWQWQDPFTRLYTTWEQHKLEQRYEQRVHAYRPPAAPQPTAAAPAPKRAKPDRVAVEARRLALDARRYRTALHAGDPVGRIRVPRLHLHAILVAGTDHASLTKGPGWYRGSFLPGQGQLVYIAGHRTTYSAPFAEIDHLRKHDLVVLEVPYGTFVYRISGYRIVPANDVSRLRSPGHEVVALQACHPRFSAKERYIAYALPVRVEPRDGRPYGY